MTRYNDEELLDALNEFSLATVYLLPLIGLNHLMFGGRRNFVDCMVNPEGTFLYVEIVSPEFCDNVYHHPMYVGDVLYTDPDTGYKSYLITFKLPPEWFEDFLTWYRGEYRRFTGRAKKLIREGSGLPYKKKENGKVQTDMRLLVMETSPEMRAKAIDVWNQVCGTDVPDTGQELLWAPGWSELIVVHRY